MLTTHSSSAPIPALPPGSEPLPVAGVVPMTTVDFPGRLAMVIFTQGCPWRCPYCHNAAMRPFGVPSAFTWAQINKLLRERRGFLDAVVFSGGEPLCHPGLSCAIRAARHEGFAVGLHTAGMFPDRLPGLLPELDWVGLDIKAPLDERYDRISGEPGSAAKVLASLTLLLGAKIALQLRTTVAPGLFQDHDLEDLRQQLRALKAPETVVQIARPIMPQSL